MNFHNAALDLKALRDHFDDEREVLVSESLEEKLGLRQEWNLKLKDVKDERNEWLVKTRETMG